MLTKAIVTTALKDEFIVGWSDLIKLGVIGNSFPHPIKAIQLKNTNPELVNKLKSEFPDAFSDTLLEEALKGPKMKIHLMDNAVTRAIATTRPIPLHWKEEAD